MKNFKDRYQKAKDFADNVIRQELQKKRNKYYPSLYNAMEYSLFSGGKRVRPVLLMWCSQTGTPDKKAVRKSMAAIEYIHTYSLIHDDLPSMDDDDIRRGMPASHKKFGEALAILSGDALLTEAFLLLAETGICSLSEVLAGKAGAAGMAGGQAADIEKIRDVEYINELKTATLFEAAAVMGGICCAKKRSSLDRLSVYGINLGRAFQLRDDLLDSEAEDIEKTREKALSYVETAKAAVKNFKNKQNLLELADFMVKRKK